MKGTYFIENYTKHKGQLLTWRELLRIFKVDFDVIDQQLIRHSAFF